MKILIVGYTGKMGLALRHMLAHYPQFEAIGLSRSAQDNCVQDIHDAQDVSLIIDFSRPEALHSYLSFAIEHHIPCVIATTGYTEDQMGAIRLAGRLIPVFYSANTSKGIYVLKHLIKTMNRLCPEDQVDLYEVHHTQKADAPSGTAKALIETIQSDRPIPLTLITHPQGPRAKDELHLHVSRMGSVIGDHSVVYSNEAEAIELKHVAYTKANFAKGALDAALWLLDKEAGYYTMEDLYGNIFE